MSLESALDEERREILKLLEGPTHPQPSRGSASAGPARSAALTGRTDSPLGARSPVRSMLDIDDDPRPRRHASIAGLGVGVTNPSGRSASKTQTVRTLLEPDASAHPAQSSNSANTSPLDSPPEQHVHRTASDASSHPPKRGLRFLRDREKGSVSGLSPKDYQFEMNPSPQVGAVPKRVTRSGKKSGFLPNSMARVAHAFDVSESGPYRAGNERGRDSITPAGLPSSSTSRSPSSRFGRSQSPHTQKLHNNSLLLDPGPGKFVSDGGQVVDLNNAYRRLSDAHLALSGGSLATLTNRRASDAERGDDGERLSPAGGGRLHKDYYGEENEEEAVTDSSDDGSGGSSAGEWGSEDGRGRVRNRNRRGSGGSESTMAPSGELGGDSRGPRVDRTGRAVAKGPRKTLSLLAAAEEERREVSQRYQVRSLLSPPVTITGPGGERINPKKAGVHPTTSFDLGASTPVTSDTEADMSDIKRAQRMSIRMSAITTTPESHRSMRTIVRGEYSKLLEEVEEGARRQRTYLVATDLSDEAAYALEWTIGTILRDGDTLLALYAMDEDGNAAKTSDGGEGGQGVGIGEGALLLKDQSVLAGTQTPRAPSITVGSSLQLPSALTVAEGGQSGSASPDSRNISKAEQERMRATEDISTRCVKLLRRTRLQVRVVVEVIHCKSPKHLITEVIDFVEPTLVILGSRGRSALKGVLLGSFSNYLVTKSSVPVMVARKRLRKHSKFKKTTNVRQANNLPPANGLASAKID